MAWLRTSDDAATYPAFLRIDEHPKWDERLKCEMFGFLLQVATLAAQHYTDYVVSLGTARLVAGTRAVELLTIAEECELVTRVTVDGREQWKLLDDPNWIHMLSKEEKARNDQRKKDLSDSAVVIPVRVRDGDQCRYCGIVVNWRDRKGARGGTYDHRNGIDGQADPDNVVVCCRACNSSRSNDPEADTRVPLRKPPAQPYYSQSTADWINENYWAQANGICVTATGGTQPLPLGEAATEPTSPAEQHQGQASDARSSDSGGDTPPSGVVPSAAGDYAAPQWGPPRQGDPGIGVIPPPAEDSRRPDERHTVPAASSQDSAADDGIPIYTASDAGDYADPEWFPPPRWDEPPPEWGPPPEWDEPPPQWFPPQECEEPQPEWAPPPVINDTAPQWGPPRQGDPGIGVIPPPAETHTVHASGDGAVAREPDRGGDDPPPARSAPDDDDGPPGVGAGRPYGGGVTYVVNATNAAQADAGSDVSDGASTKGDSPPGFSHTEQERVDLADLTDLSRFLTDFSRSWQIDQTSKSGFAGSGRVRSGRSGSGSDRSGVGSGRDGPGSGGVGQVFGVGRSGSVWARPGLGWAGDAGDRVVSGVRRLKWGRGR